MIEQPTTRTRNISCCILLSMLACPACVTVGKTALIDRYRVDATSLPRIRRIAVIPFEPGPAPESAAELMKNILAAELSKRYDVVEFLRPPVGLVQPEGPTLIDELLMARDELGADAALLGKIVGYRPHDPPTITMSLSLISTTDGTVIWAASGTIDSARPDVEERIKEYYTRTQERSRSLFGWRTMLLAERRYLQFVANEFLLTMSAHRRP
jgi:hypothetical protein